MNSLPPFSQQGEVRYLSGGVGSAEALPRDLVVMFVAWVGGAGKFFSRAQASIHDVHCKVVSCTVNGGP